MKRLHQEAMILKIANRSKMNKYELKEAIRKHNTKAIQTGEDTYCVTCSKEQYQQRCIDEKVYHQKLLESTIRKLSCYGCKWCKSEHIAVDGDIEICVDCGTVIDK